jgi:hypothetical protein
MNTRWSLIRPFFIANIFVFTARLVPCTTPYAVCCKTYVSPFVLLPPPPQGKRVSYVVNQLS